MSLYFPEAVTAQGTVKVKHVPAFANSAAPKLTEVNATGAIDLSCFLMEGSATATVEANKGNAPRRLCSRETFERFGNKTYSIADLMYVYSPQGTAAAAENAAYTGLTEGLTGFLVYRYGLDARATDFVVGQFVVVFPVTYGPRNETADTSDEYAEIHVVQSVVVRAPKIERVALVA